MLSIGDLERKTIPGDVSGPVLTGRDDCASGFDNYYYLSCAVRDALKGTEYDTLVDVDVIATTGLLVWSNSIEVRGIGVDSSKLPGNGGGR